MLEIVIVLIGAAAAVGVAGTWLLQRFAKDTYWFKRLRSTPHRDLPIHAATPIARLRGQIVAADPTRQLVAPLSGRVCVAYREKGRYQVKEELAWIPFHERLETTPLLLQQGDHTIAIDTERLELRLVTDVQEDAPSAVTRRLFHDFEEPGLPVDPELQRTEAVLEPGTEVVVLARVRERIDPNSERTGLREPPTRVVLEAPDEHALFICADPEWLAKLH